MPRKSNHDSLTTKRVIALRWDGRSEDIVWDASPKAGGSGFGVRMYATGRKEYVFKPRARTSADQSVGDTRSKLELIVIGSTRELSLSEARSRVQELRLAF